MRRIVDLLIVFCLLSSAFGQNTNPQQSFDAQEQLAGPSLLMHFNDATASFKDSVSGLSMTNSAPATTESIGGTCSNTASGTAVSSVTCSITATQGDALVIWTGSQGLPVAGVTSSLSGSATLITSNGNYAEWYIANATAGANVITATWTGTSGSTTVAAIDIVGAARVSPVAVFNSSATNSTSPYTTGSVTTTAANEMVVGFFQMSTAPTFTGPFSHVILPWAGSGTIAGYYLAPTTGSYGFTGTGSVTSYGGLIVAIKPSPNVSGTVSTRQPGFDNTNPSQYSAAFPYNGWSAAPNNTLGSIEWSVPWTMLVHLDRLNWNRAGALVLASKGDSSISMNSWWKLSLNMSGNFSQLCFTRNGANVAGSGITNAQSTVCTNSAFDALPNGFNYDIVLVDSGTGHPSSLSLYINGLNGSYIPETVSSGSYQYGFGAVNLAIAGGTGYASSTAFTSTGGGPNCTVSGSIPAVVGVPTAGALNTGYMNNYDAGCTSIPTIVLTGATGTGMTITGTLAGASMNSTNLPLMVPGYVSAGMYYGVAGTANTQTSTNVDEFAIFPGVLSQTQIQSLFYLTKFYQKVVKALPATPNTLVFDDDGCGDTDNIYALALTIAAQKIGYIRLAGVVDSSGDGVSEAMYRQMLDQAGLAHVPMTIPSVFGSSVTACTAANRSTFDASTSQVASSYPQAKAMYRQIFASNPTTPVFIMLGGSFRGMADLMGSGADSISPLTGAQLIAQNAANGGAIYAQGLGANMSFSGDNSLQDWTAGQFVVTHNGAMPIYWYGGQPQNTGPGVLSTRTGKDSIYLMAATLGTDMRQGYDSLPAQSFLSTLFSGGVSVAISGAGTGYAAQTPFTSTGGGANCVVTGIMVATGGIPSSIISTGGSGGAALTYAGLGSGCFTAGAAPTIVLTAPSGTGVVLTATTTMSGCGTVTITSATSGSTSTGTCSNHYFLPFSLNAGSSPVQGALMEWFINSLVDPMPGGAPRGR
jgi:hypothetical protein